MYVRNLTGSPPYGGVNGNRVLSYSCLKNPGEKEKVSYRHRQHNASLKSDGFLRFLKNAHFTWQSRTNDRI